MLNRRDFIKQAAAGGALLAASPVLAPVGAQEKRASAVRFSVCIDMIMTGLPFLERMERIKRLGYSAFEFWEWKNKDVEAIARKKDELGLEVATIMGSGWKQMNTEAARRAFVEEIRNSIKTAKRLGSKTMIVTTGLEERNAPREQQRSGYVSALKAAAPYVEEAQLAMVLEPLNTTVDHPLYYLTTAKEAIQIIDEVASPALRLLFDIYHHQIMEGNIIQDIKKNIAKIAHFHAADVPGRHEPGTGEINYANVFRAIEESGYRGFVGLEFKPSRNAEEALKEVLKIGSR